MKSVQELSLMFLSPSSRTCFGFGVILLLGSACSTPKPLPNSRLGFFDSVSSSFSKPRDSKNQGSQSSDLEETSGGKTFQAQPLVKVGPSDYLKRRIPASKRAKEVSKANRENPAPVEKTSRWRWPLESVSITSPFGKRGKRFHEGVDLKAEVGTPVYSIASGQVIYAGYKIEGYGKMVVIKHPDTGLFSIYAHASTLEVEEGDQVSIGTLIAHSGKSGRVRGPHLHFEIRRGVNSMDPESLLPTHGVRVAYNRKQKSGISKN